MFGIGFGELVIIFVVALIVLGPKRLPEFARSVAKVYREVMGTINEVKSTVIDDTVKTIPKDYIPPNVNQKWDYEEKEDNDNEGIKKGMKEYQNINLENYEPKREKISFKKGNKEDKKEDLDNVSKDK